jgi:hypothetical protein
MAGHVSVSYGSEEFATMESAVILSLFSLPVFASSSFVTFSSNGEKNFGETLQIGPAPRPAVLLLTLLRMAPCQMTAGGEHMQIGGISTKISILQALPLWNEVGAIEEVASEVLSSGCI